MPLIGARISICVQSFCNHLKRYANKLDYAMRMRQYMDHYLKGEPAAAWITEGEPYRGR